MLTAADAVADDDLAALRDLAGDGAGAVVVHRGDPRGTVAESRGL